MKELTQAERVFVLEMLYPMLKMSSLGIVYPNALLARQLADKLRDHT